MHPPSNEPGSSSTESLDTSALDPRSMAPVSDDDELLVAYLDGELDALPRSQLENRLGAEPALRARLDQLRAAWDLLDELPSVAPNPNFAQSTIEMVAMSAEVMQPTSSGWALKRLRKVAWLLLLPLAAVLGYVATRAWQRGEEYRALEQLHVLADWDALEDVGSVEWLEKLHAIQADLVRVSKRPTTNSSLGVGLVPKSIDERREWISQLSSTDRDRLSANLEKFNEYARNHSKKTRQRIIDLANHIYASPDAESYLATARSYAIFLGDMNVSDRAAHQDQQDLTRRLADLQSRVNRKLVEVYANELTNDSPDRLAVEDWKRQMRLDYRGQLPGDSVEIDLARKLAFRDSIIDSADLELLQESLSPEAREILGRLQDPTLQQMALIIYFANPSQSRRAVDRNAAIEQFQKLPPERQAQLEFLPPDQVQGQLGLGNDQRRRPFRTR